ncbi:transcription-associated recombination protein Thp1p [Pseudovirgaria hyperparasitica]|uniref:Protein CSN12 homolog n=1 Tax=Pseudovirgaria hyperparasitica TaxID=470096 RepID=A0A6A6W939_9PEZI|nr:transcription-associated recombination protein Thp1p [Pseudovirgaria hyperparasitica]KAF2758709.1 transcription-associated recombination protein Thp1p [Pseudovirgaria hyperparasitica]
MDRIIEEFKRAQHDSSGYDLAATLSPIPPLDDGGRLYAFSKSTNNYAVAGDIRDALGRGRNATFSSRAETDAWVDVFVAYWKAVGDILNAEEAQNRRKFIGNEWTTAYDAWKDVVNALIKGHAAGHFPAWTIPCLYTGGRYLRVFAIKADKQTTDTQGKVAFTDGLGDDVVSSANKNEKLEDTARQLMRIFSLFLGDRSPIEDSRKWGIYYIANLLFKTHFKINSINLSKNILRTLHAQSDLPALERFPKAHQTTFKYYAGVIFFLDEDYIKAENYLTDALVLCHKDAKKNRELILTYLIPCHLLTTHTLPTSALLGPYPRLEALFQPLAMCIKRGDLAGYDAALASGEAEFVKRRIYLTLERGRDIALRNLLRKVYLSAGYEPPKEGDPPDAPKVRKSRIALVDFHAAVRLSMGKDGESLDQEEVECLMANMIYKNLMKGYISHDHGKVVLQKGDKAFPGTGV